MHAYRSHTCGQLRPENAGQEIRISGWVHRVRDHGGRDAGNSRHAGLGSLDVGVLDDHQAAGAQQDRRRAQDALHDVEPVLAAVEREAAEGIVEADLRAGVSEAGGEGGASLRGPVGGWFSWDPVATDPVLLVAGGSGLVPLMAMVRTRQAVGSTAPFRLVSSVRSPEEALYLDELARASWPLFAANVSAASDASSPSITSNWSVCKVSRIAIRTSCPVE